MTGYNNPPPGQMGVRIQASTDKKKAKRQYEDLMRAGQLDSAMIIGKLTRDRGYHVLSQGMSPTDMTQAIRATVEVLAKVAEEQRVPMAEKTFGLSAGVEVGRAGPALKDRLVTRDAEGLLHPPKGQTFMTCGECQSSSWYMTLDADDQPALMVCTSCQNEVKWRRDVMHQPPRTAQ